jgi:ubiquinone/menaquinone biosynthesis C-methylase UbiE
MIEVATGKAAATGDAARFRFPTGAAEDLDLPACAFDPVTIGNAFRRLRRDVVASNVRRWLRPGGHLALLGRLTDRWRRTVAAHAAGSHAAMAGRERVRPPAPARLRRGQPGAP